MCVRCKSACSWNRNSSTVLLVRMVGPLSFALSLSMGGLKPRNERSFSVEPPQIDRYGTLLCMSSMTYAMMLCMFHSTVAM